MEATCPVLEATERAPACAATPTRDTPVGRTNPDTINQQTAASLATARLDPPDVMALQRTVGNRAVVQLLADRKGAAKKAAEGPLATTITSQPSGTIVHRYTELGADALEAPNKALAPIWMSEGNKFFRRAAVERELWAEGPEIESANAITGHQGGILDVTAGEPRTVNGKKYNRVVVSNRTAASGGGAKGSGERRVTSASEPFEKILEILTAHSRGKLGDLILKTKETFNPYPYGTYANGAFEAIRTQFGLEIGKQIDAAPDGKEHKVDAGKLETFIKSWQARIAEVNSEEAHRFQFLVTECGGFSKMVSAGDEGTQATVEAGGRMRMDVDEDIPGPWRNHYAAVIMTDGPDRVTLESAAGMDKWWFGMYGSRDLGQTFIVKTLLAKLDIGATAGQAGSSDAADYVRSKLAGNEEAASLSASRLKEGLQAHLDGLLAEAQTKSKPGPKVAPVVQPGKALADRAAGLRAELASASTKLLSTLLIPPLSEEQRKLGKKFTEAGVDQLQSEYKLLMAAKADELGAVVARIKAERERLLVSTVTDATAFSQVESRNLTTEKARWFGGKEAQITFETRIRETRNFLNAWVNTTWLPDAEPSAVIPEIVPEVGGSVISSKAPKSELMSPPPSLSSSMSPPQPSPSSPSSPSSSSAPERREPAPTALRVIPSSAGLSQFLTTLDAGWSTVGTRAHGSGGGGMIVGAGMGVMLGEASKAKDAVPVHRTVVLPPELRFVTNNGSRARCFVYSIVMGLTGRPQEEVEEAVGQIADRAQVGEGWIALDTKVAKRVVGEVEGMFGVEIQVIELQTSVGGLWISGRSHDATPEERRPIVIRNTGGHFDAII